MSYDELDEFEDFESEDEAREGAADTDDDTPWWDEGREEYEGEYAEYDGTEGVDLAHEDLDDTCQTCDSTGEFPVGHVCKSCGGSGHTSQ